jgi:hypothetical protein
MSEGSGPPSAGADDYQVLQYLAALETRRAAPSTFAQPDRIVDDLASAEMGQSAGEPDALRRQLGAHAPGSEANVERLEDGFVAGAKEYARRHGLGYEAWIQAGVDPAVLDRAGIHPEPS